MVTPLRLWDVVRAHWRAARTWHAKLEVAVGMVWWAPQLAWYEVRWQLRRVGYWARGQQQALVIRVCQGLWQLEGWARRSRERGECWLRTRPWMVGALQDEPSFSLDETQINCN